MIPTSEHKNGTRSAYTDPRQPIVVPPDWLLQRVAVNDRQRIAANKNQAPYFASCRSTPFFLNTTQ